MIYIINISNRQNNNIFNYFSMYQEYKHDIINCQFAQHNESIKIKYSNRDYTVPLPFARQIGFLVGMIDSGLSDNLELPQPDDLNVRELGHQVIEHLETNPITGLNFLQNVILCGQGYKEYIAQIKSEDKNKSIDKIRTVLAQVFSLVALADYWDCGYITNSCTEFLGLHFAIADPILVKEWLDGIV